MQHCKGNNTKGTMPSNHMSDVQRHVAAGAHDDNAHETSVPAAKPAAAVQVATSSDRDVFAETSITLFDGRTRKRSMATLPLHVGNELAA